MVYPMQLAIDGVLGEADRFAAEEAARSLVKCRGQADELAMAVERNQFFKYLGQFGMTLSERSKISVPKESPF